MDEPSVVQPPFQMFGTRAAILDGPIASAIEQQVRAIENSLESVPDFAFDLAKTLVESVCKTVLADIGQPADPGWEGPRLFKETTKRLSLLPRDHPDPTKAEESVTKTLRGMVQTVHGLCELRNGYGMASHGRDSFSTRLDLRQATLAAQAADTIVSFVYRVHRDSLMQAPGTRVYYEDHKEFNDSFDGDHDTIRLGEVELLASRVLFQGDPEAYKAALSDFLAEQSEEATSAADNATSRAAEEGE